MNDDRATSPPMAKPLGRTETLAQIQLPSIPHETNDNDNTCDIQIDGTQPLDEDVTMDEPQV
jgi:hypothetical protein